MWRIELASARKSLMSISTRPGRLYTMAQIGSILHSSRTVHEKRGVGEEMNSVSVLQSEKKLVDVTGIEPVTPCLQS